MNKKIVGVLFSGGLDSTYLVWKNLKDGNIVIPIYIEISNNYNKTIIEKNRIKLLYKEFSKEYSNNIKNIEYILKLEINTFNSNVYLKQVPIWILGILFAECLNADEFQIGYVCGDDSVSFISDIKRIYKSYLGLVEKQPPIKFPLTKEMKSDLYYQLPNNYKEYIFSCENPVIVGSEKNDIIRYNACCNCCACKTIISSKYYGNNRYPDEYKNNLIKDSIFNLNEYGYNVYDKYGNYSELPIFSTNPKQLNIVF